MGFAFVLILHPTGAGDRGVWVSGSVVPSCWLELNHNMYQLAIAIYLQSLLPRANAICGSHEHIHVLLLFMNSIRTNFSLCSTPLIKTCSPLLFITLTSENISLNWYSTFQCGGWRVSQPLRSSSFYLFIFIFCFRLFTFLLWLVIGFQVTL